MLYAVCVTGNLVFSELNGFDITSDIMSNHLFPFHLCESSSFLFHNSYVAAFASLHFSSSSSL